MGRRSSLAGLVVVALALASASFAQGADASHAALAAAYARAEEAFVAALRTDLGRAPSLDDTVWRAAVAAADELVAAAEQAGAADQAAEGQDDLLRAYRLRAHVYGATNWYIRAFSAWNAFLDEGGELSGRRLELPGDVSDKVLPDEAEFRRVVGQLAFARYEAGDMSGARSWYLTLLDMVPDDPEALRWLARIAFEENDTAAAVVIWQRLVEVAPDDEGARFFLDLSRERERYGEGASEAYRLGLREYEAGDLASALDAFRAAVAGNPEFTDASVWAGRTALELDLPKEAVDYWVRATTLAPDDARSRWFLEYAMTLDRWGVEAGRAYYAGLAAYEAGELDAAAERFLAAAEAAPEFVDAYVWAARSTQEAGRPAEAIAYWQAVLRLDRTDERARYFIRNARQAIAHGTAAADAYARGMAAYEAGDGPTAQAEFAAATAAAPDFTLAWAYLGQVAFQNRDYAVAATAYGRAAELEPDNDDYPFFAGEAERLAGAREESNGAAPDTDVPGEGAPGPDIPGADAQDAGTQDAGADD